MFLAFLEIKAKLNQPSKEQHFEKPEEIDIPVELHHKIVAMKPTRKRKAEKVNSLIDKINDRIKDKYGQKSYAELRDAYFRERGYL